MDTDNNIPFATEIIRTLKKIIYMLVILQFLTITAFLWYISLPSEDISFDTEEGNATYVGNDLNGGLYNGENESNKKNIKDTVSEE
jgi:hypothetical protein